MAHLASVGSRAINGVAALHTEPLKQTVLRDFYAVAPDKFLNGPSTCSPTTPAQQPGRRWPEAARPQR